MNLFLVIASIFVALLLLEIAVRVVDRIDGHGFFSSHRNPLATPPRKVRPFRTFGPDFYKTINGQRYIVSRHDETYPVRKVPGVYRIVAFGGSTTANNATYKKAGLHYPGLLQEHLNAAAGDGTIEVINVGNPAYATPHSLILLELDVLSWDPDLVIVNHNINDLTVSYWPGFRFDYANKYRHRYYSIPDTTRLYSTTNALFQHFRLYWLIRERLDRIGGEKTIEMQHVSYGPRPPAAAQEIFRRNLETFIAIARSNGIEVLLSTQPLDRQPASFARLFRGKPYNSVVRYPRHGEFVSHHGVFNDLIRAVAIEHSALLFDADKMLAAKPEYFRDVVHYTVAGVRQLARGYADILIARAPWDPRQDAAPVPRSADQPES